MPTPPPPPSRTNPPDVRKLGVRLPGKGSSNSYGARPVHLIIPMIKWIRTNGSSIKKFFSPPDQSHTFGFRVRR